jgi:hypothetical protein
MTRRREPIRVIAGVRMLRILIITASLAGSLTLAPMASAYESFDARISYISVLRYTGSITVNASARYYNSDCSPSYACDRNVRALFEVREGFSPYGRLVLSELYDETGQYLSSLRVSFRAARCTTLPRLYSKTYTVVMTAVSPTGEEKTDWKSFTIHSCR